MLHLAQVKPSSLSGVVELQLLAHQQSDGYWELDDRQSLSCEMDVEFAEGVLVLVELAEDDGVIAIDNATDWVINLIKSHLTLKSKESEAIETEKTRIEQWRQEITAKSLDLTRRQLELETHQEQVQELEAKLKEERAQLELRWQALDRVAEE